MVHLILLLTSLAAAALSGAAVSQSRSDAAIHKEIEALNAAMVAAFKRDPGSVAAFYTDEALIVGGGQRSEGRAAVIEYWKGAAMFSDWTLDTLQAGGSMEAPWQYGRSVVVSRSGRTMETFFLGLLRRQPSGELKMHVDAYSRERKTIDPAEAARITETWLRATRGDPDALKVIRDDPFGKEQGDWQAWLDQSAAQFSGSVLIARADTEEIVSAYGLADRRASIRNTVDTRFNLGSINKTFTAIAVAQLIQLGRLSLDDTLAKHLPDYPNREAAATITIHQLLAHRSGVATFMQADFGNAPSVAEMTRMVGSEPQKFEPGARQEYSNGGYVVLGRVVEVVSGKSYNDYISENIFKPAGMTDAGFVGTTSAEPTAAGKGGSGSRAALGYFAADAQGRPVMGGQGGAEGFNLPGSGNPAGGGYATVRDVFRFSRALRNGRLLDQRMTDYVLNGTFSGQSGPKFGFALREQVVGGRRFIGNGGGAPGVNAEFRFEPAGDDTVVVLSNASPPSATQLLTRIMDRLALRAISQKPQ